MLVLPAQGPHFENSHPPVAACWLCFRRQAEHTRRPFRWVYLGSALPPHGCAPLAAPETLPLASLEIRPGYFFFMIQMGGFCISPVKGKKVEVWFLRQPHSSEPGRCICDWRRKNADGAAGPSPALAGPHATRHLLLCRNKVHSPTGALGRAEPSPTERQLSLSPIRRLSPSPLLTSGWIQKTGSFSKGLC